VVLKWDLFNKEDLSVKILVLFGAFFYKSDIFSCGELYRWYNYFCSISQELDKKWFLSGVLKEREYWYNILLVIY
tara:strand:+ start:27768 stop:27992 length:225 start_codon:yes stop_codon:yes gene_type:complete